jgi:hypothetical protein
MDDGDMTIDDLVEQLNDVITGLRTTVQYNVYKDDINEMLKQIKLDFGENNGEGLDPRVKNIYLNLPEVNNITLASQIPIVHNVWIFLQERNNNNWEVDSDNSQASDREYVEPHDFFPELIPAAEGRKSRKYKASRKGRKTQLLGNKSKKCRKGRKGKKCRKSRKSRKGRKSRRH